MASAVHSPPSFPVRSFVWIGASWVVLDLAVILALWSFFQINGPAIDRSGGITLIAWQAVLAAKFMLLLGWLWLGEGEWGHRAAGFLLFATLLVPLLVAGVIEPDILCVLVGMLVFGLPLAGLLSLPFMLLAAIDYRLARDVPPIAPKQRRQFTVRQLMFVTLLAAVVMGLLRWAKIAELNYAVIGLQLPLLAWVFPAVITVGLFLPRLYPGGLYAAGLTAFLLALPSFTLPGEAAHGMTLFVGAYTLFFALHVLLLRGLGYRLTQTMPQLYHPGIIFLNTPHDRGVVFLATGRDPGVVFLDEQDKDTTLKEEWNTNPR